MVPNPIQQTNPSIPAKFWGSALWTAHFKTPNPPPPAFSPILLAGFGLQSPIAAETSQSEELGHFGKRHKPAFSRDEIS